MKQIEITITKYRGESTPWTERYDIEDTADPEVYADHLMAFFNSTCRPGEMKRKWLSVKVLGVGLPGDHAWDKDCLVTISDRLGVYDKMKCSQCGVTGKRFGLNSGVKRDSIYRAKMYEKCSGAPLPPSGA